MNVGKYFKSKVVLFIIQIAFISILIYIFQYQFIIEFDNQITSERLIVIQILANYVIFDALSDFIFMLIIWLSASLIAILLLKETIKASIMNLTSYFFPNFFFYVFLFRYSRQYFDNHFIQLFCKTFILALIIGLFSIGLSLILKSVKFFETLVKSENLSFIIKEIKTKCPKCGTEFDSSPKYCYKCNTELTEKVEG